MPESEIQQAIAPLIRSMDKMEASFARIEERINSLPSIYLPRSEYEPRHRSLEDDIKELKQAQNDIIKRIGEREDAAKSHNVTVLVAIGMAIVSIALKFVK